MKVNAIAQMLTHPSFNNAQIIITVTDKDGAEKEIALLDPDDFVNEAVPSGTTVHMVYSNCKIYTGVLDSLEDEDGQLVIYIRSVRDQSTISGFPFDKLVGYYKE